MRSISVTRLRPVAAVAARKVFVHPELIRYIQRVTAATRDMELAAYGASPRGALSAR